MFCVLCWKASTVLQLTSAVWQGEFCRPRLVSYAPLRLVTGLPLPRFCAAMSLFGPGPAPLAVAKIETEIMTDMFNK
jgi:hypothetical protein